jgi:hypothetical protein
LCLVHPSPRSSAFAPHNLKKIASLLISASRVRGELYS